VPCATKCKNDPGADRASLGRLVDALFADSASKKSENAPGELVLEVEWLEGRPNTPVYKQEDYKYLLHVHRIPKDMPVEAELFNQNIYAEKALDDVAKNPGDVRLVVYAREEYEKLADMIKQRSGEYDDWLLQMTLGVVRDLQALEKEVRKWDAKRAGATPNEEAGSHAASGLFDELHEAAAKEAYKKLVPLIAEKDARRIRDVVGQLETHK